MIVEIHDGMKQALRLPATRVVVYDIYDNPIAVVMQVENGQYVATTAAQKAFPKILQALGINKTLIVDRIDPRKLKPLEA